MTGLSHGAWIGVLFRKWIRGAGNLFRNYRTVSRGLACYVGLKLIGGAVKYHSTWCVGLKKSWRGRLGRLDRSGGTDGDRAVWTF